MNRSIPWLGVLWPWLVGCNSVLDIHRHESVQGNPTTGGASATSGVSGGGTSGTGGIGGTGDMGGGDIGGGGIGGADGMPSSDSPFTVLWGFESMNGNQVLPNSGLSESPALVVQGGSLAPGPTGNHLTLAETGASAVTAEPVFDSSGDYSVSVWARLDQLNRWDTIVSQDGQSVSAFYLQKRDTGNFAFTTLPADSTEAVPCVAMATLKPSTGEWYHLTGTRDGATGEQRLYVDGVLSAQATCQGAFRARGPLAVGRGKWEQPSDWMTGAIDELGVSGRVLSPAEIVALYELGRPDTPHYLFAYFEEVAEGRGDGLRFAHSHDALRWGTVGPTIFLPPTVGGQSFRDPHVMRDPNGTYHLVWTSSCVPWAELACVQDRGFAHATSKDLVSFTEPTFIEVPKEKLNVEHFWAPQTFYDAASEQYLLFWSSPLDVTIEADPHGIYYMLTKDFVTFSDPAVLYARPGRNFIDASIAMQGNTYFMFLKDEAEGQKNVRVIASPSLFGISAWTAEASPALTGAYAAEGPAPLLQDGRLLLYFDKYGEQTTGALRARDSLDLTDPAAWEDITSSVSASRLRHGSLLQVDRDVFRAVALRAAQ
jgi:hypothetical protein